jgi:hypothetical protein
VNKQAVEEEAVNNLKPNEMMTTAQTMFAGINLGKLSIMGEYYG